MVCTVFSDLSVLVFRIHTVFQYLGTLLYLSDFTVLQCKIKKKYSCKCETQLIKLLLELAFLKAVWSGSTVNFRLVSPNIEGQKGIYNIFSQGMNI